MLETNMSFTEKKASVVVSQKEKVKSVVRRV